MQRCLALVALSALPAVPSLAFCAEAAVPPATSLRDQRKRPLEHLPKGSIAVHRSSGVLADRDHRPLSSRFRLLVRHGPP